MIDLSSDQSAGESIHLRDLSTVLPLGRAVFLCVKEWVKYLLILEGRGVEISQRQGERWSRSVQVFSISAFPLMHLTRRSQAGLTNPSKR